MDVGWSAANAAGWGLAMGVTFAVGAVMGSHYPRLRTTAATTVR